jgi:hypothetical protein
MIVIRQITLSHPRELRDSRRILFRIGPALPGHMFQHACGADGGAARAAVAYCRCGHSHAGFRVRATPLQDRLNGNGREFEDFLVLQVGVGSAVSASLARQIENAVDWPDRVEGAGVAALERHLARPVVVDPVLVA